MNVPETAFTLGPMRSAWALRAAPIGSRREKPRIGGEYRSVAGTLGADP